MTKYILCIFFNLVSIFSFGQEERLKGKIIADSLEDFAINIVNYTKKLGTTNDQTGYFEIPASPGDSIIFSSVQYKVISVVVAAEDLRNSNYKIHLTPTINELDEVAISNVKLSGNILKDASSIEVSPLLTNRSLGLPFKDIKQPTVPERRLYTASSTALDLLINTLSGKIKKLKQLKKMEELDVVLTTAKNSFNLSFFVEDLKIPEIYIADFLYYCSEDADFENLVDDSKKLVLLEFLQQKALYYIKEKNLGN